VYTHEFYAVIFVSCHATSENGAGQILWLNRMMQALVMHCLATWRNEIASVTIQLSSVSLAWKSNTVC
jgi:hypothetical protein